MIKSFIEFGYPGTLFLETTVREAESRAAPKELPADADSYRFFGQSVATQEQDGESIAVRGARRDVSGWVYPGGVAYGADSVEREFPGDRHSILRFNVRVNKFKRIVKTSRGRITEMADEDSVT